MEWRRNTLGKLPGLKMELANKVESKWMKKTRDMDKWHGICDQLVMAVAFDFDITWSWKKSVDWASVETSGRFTRGQMILERRPKVGWKPRNNPTNLVVVEKINEDFFKNILLQSMS